MSDNRIDASQPKTKLYEEDPAKIAEDKAKADFEASKMTTSKSSCSEDPERFPCAPPAKDKTPNGVPFSDLAKTMSQPKPAPAPVPVSVNPNLHENKTGILPNTTNATRTADQQDGVLVVTAGKDGVSRFAGLTALKESDENGYIAVGSVSVQGGAGVEVQAAALRGTVRMGDRTSASAELFTAHASAGVGKNDDGSVGYHSGAGLTAAAMEGTRQLDDDGTTLTLGVSAGVGADVSVGTKQNANGETLLCRRVSAGPFTIGFCHPM